MTPVTDTSATEDEKYLQLLIGALRVCTKYKPKFGKGRAEGLNLAEFQSMYAKDPFYNWIGLDSPLMYAAHKAAGGMTSVYRQIGIGCEWIFSAVLEDTLGLSPEQASWTYEVPGAGEKTRKLSLDGRIDLGDVKDASARRRVKAWMKTGGARLLLPRETLRGLHGVVFEVRQGYKSKDSKRQNADISNASNAYAHQYMPVLLLLSTQIDSGVATRYTQAQWLLLNGATAGETTNSTYVFCREVLGYDLASFFERNSEIIKAELDTILELLLEAA